MQFGTGIHDQGRYGAKPTEDVTWIVEADATGCAFDGTTGNRSERTQFGYQVKDPSDVAPTAIARSSFGQTRPLGFTATGVTVQKLVLPIGDQALYQLGQAAGLPMSDIFSFITARAVPRYHEALGDAHTANIRPILSPISARKSSLDLDEGNNRLARHFPITMRHFLMPRDIFLLR